MIRMVAKLSAKAKYEGQRSSTAPIRSPGVTASSGGSRSSRTRIVSAIAKIPSLNASSLAVSLRFPCSRITPRDRDFSTLSGGERGVGGIPNPMGCRQSQLPCAEKEEPAQGRSSGPLPREHPHLLERKSEMPGRRRSLWQARHIAGLQLQYRSILNFDPRLTFEHEEHLGGRQNPDRGLLISVLGEP